MKKKIIIGISILIGLIYLIGMFLLSQESFELVHIIFEVSALLLGSAIFLTVVISMKIKQTMYISIIAPGILVATILSFIHTLAGENLNLFPTDVSDLPFLLFTLSNYIIAISFLLGGILVNKEYGFKVSVSIVFSVGFIVTVLAFNGYLPQTVIDGQFSQFKYISDYIIMIIYFVSLLLLYKSKSFFTKKQLNYFSLVITIFAFSTLLNFSLVGYTDNENFFRVLLRLFGLAILYIPIFEGNIKNPFEILVKELSYENELNKRLKEKMYLLLDTVEEGIYGIDINDKCIFVNDSLLRLLKYKDRGEILGKKMHELIHHSYKDGVKYPFENCKLMEAVTMRTKVHIENEIIWTKDRKGIPVEYYSNPLYEDEKLIGAVVSFKDVTEKLKYDESLIKLSYFDHLTELHNRRYFELEVKKMDIEENYPLTLIIADLDGLKLINDSFGHQFGDEFIKKASSIMKQHCKDDCLLARMGGDEFVFVMPNTSDEQAEEYILSMEAKMNKEFINAIQLSISFGYETKNSNGKSINEMHIKAENSLYQQKLLKVNSKRSTIKDTILTTLFEKDNYSESHSQSVSLSSEKIASRFGMTAQKINEIKTAGLFHDIGKIIIPTDILNKKGVLSKSEYNEIKKHPEIGFRILSSARDMSDIAQIIFSHHERWDGKGYPNGLSGEDIPLQSRIISLADAFDAMTSDRTYKAKMTKEQALQEIIRNSGTQFDPEIVKVFEQNFCDFI